MRNIALSTLIALALAGCGQGSESEGPVPIAAEGRVAPTVAEYPAEGSDTSPGRDDGITELTLDDGTTVVAWIDPGAITDVYVQHTVGDDWSEPVRIFESGAGCLNLGAATNGTTVAIALGCYATDAFRQQAPDQGVAIVSADLTSWDRSNEILEVSSSPEVDADGSVRFVNDVYPDQVVTWSDDDGFDGD